MAPLGKAIIVLGLVLVVLGALVLLAPRVPWIGRLPGDILVRRPGSTFYFPLTTCLLLSAALTLALWLWSRFR